MAMSPLKANERGNYRGDNQSMVLKQLFIGKGSSIRGVQARRNSGKQAKGDISIQLRSNASR